MIAEWENSLIAGLTGIEYSTKRNIMTTEIIKDIRIKRTAKAICLNLE
jgi:hypothetical protein